jgi:hypothetical protein
VNPVQSNKAFYGIIYFNDNNYKWLWKDESGCIWIQLDMGVDKYIPLESDFKGKVVIFNWGLK